MNDASPGGRARPLSPHVQVWRWHVTMAASILNRAAGVAMYLGVLILTGLTLALASGPEAYAAYAGALGSWPGHVVLFGITAALFFHMANGVRHFIWDFGKGFSPKTADASALGAFAFAVAGAVIVWGALVVKGVL